MRCFDNVALTESLAHSQRPVAGSCYCGRDGALCLGGYLQGYGFHSCLHFDALLVLLHRPVGFLLMGNRSTKRLGSVGAPGTLGVVA